MRAIGTLMLSLLVCCLFAFPPARAQIAIGISIDVAPPPLPVYDQPPIPEPGYIWTPGYWAWDDDTGYYWVPGTWVLPPEPALLWTPGYWGWNDGIYAFHEGYWGPEVGFYGGVSYGYGYTGVGYEGGYWRGGAFFYNRSVNNFSNVQITNVYNKTVVVNNTTNVSYNGGSGGTTAQATPQQIAAANQHHVPPTPQQTQHMQMAAKDPALSLNNNHGHPTVAATTHAAQLSGAGVVAAHPGTPVAAIAPQGHNVGGTGGTATGHAPAGQGAKTGPGNAATIQGNHALPGVQSPGTRVRKSRPAPTPRRFPAITRFLACSRRAPRVQARQVPAAPVRRPAPATLRRCRAIMRLPVCSSMAAVPPATQPPSAAPIQAPMSKCIRPPAPVPRRVPAAVRRPAPVQRLT